MTKLESFIRANGVRVGKLAAWAGISRAHLRRLRLGVMEPTRPTMVALARAAGDWLGRRVRVQELVDIGGRGVRMGRSPIRSSSRKPPTAGSAGRCRAC